MKCIKKISELPVIDIIFILLGAMLLNDFFKYLSLGQLSVEGFANALRESIHEDIVPTWWKYGIIWIAKNSFIFAPIAGALLISTAVSLILLLVRGIAALVTALIFFVYWISLWAVAGIWFFEFLFPCIFALAAGLSCFTGQCQGPKQKYFVIGTRLFGNMKLYIRFLIVVASAALLWYVILISKNAKGYDALIAWQSAITFAFLFGISAWMDCYRMPAEEKRCGKISWITIMILSVGAMMTAQVFADHSVGFYTKDVYAKLIDSYATSTGAPTWFKAFLFWSSKQAAILMPLQAFFESLVTILIVLLIVRGPAMLALAGMFLVFTYAELGVSAVFPPLGPSAPRTDTWELLFVTLGSLAIGIKETASLIIAPTWRERIFGKRVFGNLGVIWWIIIPILAGILLLFIGLKTHVFATHVLGGYVMTSFLGAISFCILLLINALLIDRWRNTISENTY